MTLTRRCIFSTLQILVLLLPLTALAADFDESMPAQPATFSDRKSSLVNRLQFPNLPGDIFLLLLCTGELTDKGRFIGQVNCFRDKDIEDTIRPFRSRSVSNYVVPGAEVIEVTASRESFLVERFEREVIEAASNGRMEPARLEGKRAPVQFNFAVKFVKSNDVETVEVFLHHFRNAAILGTDYIASQRFLGQQNRFADEIITCPEFPIPVWIRSIVMNNGSAYNVVTEKIGGILDEELTEICVTAFKDKVKTNLYVPAITDGRYVNSFHVELFYDNPDKENNLNYQEEIWRDLIDRGEMFENISAIANPSEDAFLQAKYYREWMEAKGILPGGEDFESEMGCSLNPYIKNDPALTLTDCSPSPD